MPVVTIGKPLRDKLGDEAVDSLVDLINQSLVEQKNDILMFVEEKFERRLSEEISKLKVELLEKISEVDKRLSKKISELDSRLSEKISSNKSDLLAEAAKTKSDLIKWMFVFWIGQVAVMLGFLFALLSYLK